MKLIVGLGNPGFIYARNRHNIGFMCISHLARTQGIRFDRRQGHARTGAGHIAGNRVVLARPQTYMNASGESASLLLRRFNINTADLIVIYDDLDLPIGKIRIRQGGRSAGHKGLESIITHLRSQDFYRVRVGIGHPVLPDVSTAIKEAMVIDYVLSDFTPEEKGIINTVIPEVSQAIVCLLAEGLTAAMNKYN
jgi:PTH1 family peptidyl-tRNA hydrolase